MKKCPFCAEEIQDEAIKCKHCGEFLDGKNQPKPKQPWYARTSIIVLLLLTVGPLALPLIWVNPRWNLYTKIIITIVICLLSWWLYLWMNQEMAQIHKQLDQMTSGLSSSQKGSIMSVLPW
jgi:hypothetical protein